MQQEDLSDVEEQFDRTHFHKKMGIGYIWFPGKPSYRVHCGCCGNQPKKWRPFSTRYSSRPNNSKRVTLRSHRGGKHSLKGDQI